MESVFESERIRFVKVSLELVPDYLAMVNDIDNVARFISDRLEPYSEEEEISYIREKIDSGATMFSMLEKSTEKFIGNVEFFNIKDKEAEWGIAITGPMQDKGYGTEAIRTMVRYGMEILGLHRIFLKVYPHNARAIHVYKKCGFREYDRNDEDVFMEIVK